MCSYCLDAQCNMGSLCLRGMFAGKGDQFSPLPAGPHSQTKKYSKVGQIESEHLFPHAALKASGIPYNYNSEPTMSIPYNVHRGGVSGAGGGITSTGSSSTASGWSGHLGAMAKSDFRSALRQFAIDQANGHWMNGNLTGEVTMQIMQVVNGHQNLGRLTMDQAGSINNEIMNIYLLRGKK